uniref:OTU domain-containing protein n=1 Tax=Clastoptera arizonana TaxID=38151 RepID=A0A1B6CDN7_9HEMI
MTTRFPLGRTGRELTTRNKVWVKPTDQMDLWLDTQGFYRKHTARDGSCLFRAVSEQMFLTQVFHLEVRRRCAEFVLRNSIVFEKSINNCTVKEYTEKIKNPHEWGGKLEIEAMSLMYRKDFIIYQEIGQSPENFTNHGYKDTILLCFSQERHYDSVYTKQHINNAAFCQSIVYDLLYKGVFELQEVDYAVNKMLRDKSARFQHQRDASSFLATGFALRLEMRDSVVNVKDLLNVGITPFPYKVAKSLDPDIYRNVEYDTWNDYRRSLRFGLTLWNNRELQVGVKCLVKIKPDRTCHAHIQEIQPNKGPVLVFVEELGEKLTVPYESLELLPQPTTPMLNIPLKQLRLMQDIKPSSNCDSESSHSEFEEELDVATPPIATAPWVRHGKQWSSEDINGRKTPKIKMFLSDLSKNSKKNKCGRSKSKEGESNRSNKNAPQPNNAAQHSPTVPEVSSTNSIDCCYKQEVMEYQETYENYHGYSFINQNDAIVIQEDNIQGTNPGETDHTVLAMENATAYFTPGDPNKNYQAMVAQRSVMQDCSDLPLSDLRTLRYFYNYGVDQYMRVNRVRPGPSCCANTNQGYVPEHVANPDVSPTTPDSTEPICSTGFFHPHPRPTSLVTNMGRRSVSSDSEGSQSSQRLAPRFESRVRPVYAMHPLPFEGLPIVQQCEVSSSTPMMQPNHIYPSPVTPYPAVPQPLPAQPVFYLPVECETYCPTNYLEYGVIDMTPTTVYPTVYSHPTFSPVYSPTYFPTDSFLYPNVIQPSQIPPNI